MPALPAAITSENDGWRVLVFTAVFLPIQVIAVALRVYTRSKVDARFGWDDALCLLSLACQIVLAGLCIGAVKQGGFGYELVYLVITDPPRTVIFRKYLTAISILYFATLNIPKFAILVLFYRVFSVKKARMILYVIGAILAGHTLGTFIASVTACIPLSANWNVALKAEGAVCIDKTALWEWSSVPSIFTDIALLVFPMPFIWQLHTNVRTKLGLTFTFAVGLLGLAISIFRLSSFASHSDDAPTYNGVGQLIWAQAEPGVYLIVACLPTLRPLLESLGLGRFKASQASSGTSWGYGGGTTAVRSGNLHSKTCEYDPIDSQNVKSQHGYHHSHASTDASLGRAPAEVELAERGRSHFRKDQIQRWGHRAPV